MGRWVSIDGKEVRFENMVGTLCGRNYIYDCSSPEEAVAFGLFLSKRDPQNENMPIAVTDKDRKRFRAKERKT
jgi:hypothetical protein